VRTTNDKAPFGALRPIVEDWYVQLAKDERGKSTASKPADQIPFFCAVKAHDSYGAEMGLHAGKPLFLALLSQLHPGQDGTAERLARTGQGAGVPLERTKRERA
jgi:hypothetical protein